MNENRRVIYCFCLLCAAIPGLAQTATVETRQPEQFRTATIAGTRDAKDSGARGVIGSAAATLNAAEQAETARQFVDDRLAVWLRRLHLDDWRVSAVMTRRGDLKPQTVGGIRWDKHKKTAVIWIQDPSDYKLSFPAMLADMEFTVVHELVHLELASLPHSESSRGAEEHAVNQIASALITLDQQE